MLLPYVDQTALYNQINFNVPMAFGSITGGPVTNVNTGSVYPGQQPFTAVNNTVITAFTCPTTPRPGSSNQCYLNDWWASSVGTPFYNTGSPSDYACFAGGAICKGSVEPRAAVAGWGQPETVAIRLWMKIVTASIRWA